jgi:hypothetical protein
MDGHTDRCNEANRCIFITIHYEHANNLIRLYKQARAPALEVRHLFNPHQILIKKIKIIFKCGTICASI